MADPIIDSIVVSPTTVRPGQPFTVTIVAHDPDSRSGTLRGTVTDSQGNGAEVTAAIVIEDPLTYELEDVGNVGFAVTPRAGQPGVFDVVTP